VALAGWSLATEVAGDLAGDLAGRFDLVIASSTTEYHEPVRTDAKAVATLDPDGTNQRPNGNWELSITVALRDASGHCATLSGTYVAIQRD
jgi:hypothetical protein